MLDPEILVFVPPETIVILSGSINHVPDSMPPMVDTLPKA